MAETISLQRLAPWRGRSLLASDGAQLGTIQEIIYDAVSMAPVWIAVGSRERPHFRTLLVPARGADIEGQAVKVAFPRGVVEEQPHADFGQGFDSAGEQQHLYDYFGLPLDPNSDLRVLRTHDDLPGQEQTITPDP